METTTKLTFRDKAQTIFNSDEYFIAVAALSFTLSVWLGAPGYLLGISAVIIMLWANRWNLGILGLKKTGFITAVTKATLYSIAIFIAMDIMVQPFIEKGFGEIDISSLDGLRGNFISYVIFIVFMWVMAAFGEELFYRGFLLKRIAQMLGDTNKTWIIGAFISAIF
jgi:membrane protease YdiL (CAAX protease family)